jgi:hypothetical protein
MAPKGGRGINLSTIRSSGSVVSQRESRSLKVAYVARKSCCIGSRGGLTMRLELFAGLNILPKKSYATDYSYRTERPQQAAAAVRVDRRASAVVGVVVVSGQKPPILA